MNYKNIFISSILLSFILTITLSAQGVCDDLLYLNLKKKDLDSLSKREYEFFIQKDNLCNQFYANSISEKDKKLSIENKLHFEGTISFLVTFKMVSDLSQEYGGYISGGAILLNKHIIGINLAFGGGLNSLLAGSGLSYSYLAIVKKYFSSEIGATIGYWQDKKEINEINGIDGTDGTVTINSRYFGGPYIGLKIGYKNIFFGLKPTILFGEDYAIKLFLNPGVSLLY